MLGNLISIPYFEDNQWWYISRFSGSLIKSSEQPLFKGSAKLNKKINRALACCDNPFTCRWNSDFLDICLSGASTTQLERFNRRMFSLGNDHFLLSILYAGIYCPIFDNTNQAFSAITRLPGHLNQRADRCLQRSLLAAKTSKSFLKSGVLFIGAEFDTGEMHAWIIEDNLQPDPEDRSWINYRPLLAYTY